MKERDPFAKKLWVGAWAVAAAAGIALAGSFAVLRAGSERPPERPWIHLRSAPPSASGMLDGFTVSVVRARATPFEVEVELMVAGREEAGERLHFGPMGLEFPDGRVAVPAGGAGAGRWQLVRFPRPTAAPLAAGDELRLWMSGIVPVQSSAGTPEFPPGTALLLVRLEAAENPQVVPVGQHLPLGPKAALVLEEAWVSGSDVRLVGRFEGVGTHESQFLTVASAMFEVGGRLRPVQSWRIASADPGSAGARLWLHGADLCESGTVPCGPVSLTARFAALLPPGAPGDAALPADAALFDTLRGGLEVRASLPAVGRALGDRP